MYFVAKKLPINTSLNSHKISEFTNHLGRYNAITDLATKNVTQRGLFLDRVQSLFEQNLVSLASSPMVSSSSHKIPSLSLALITVFCQSQADFSEESFPLYDFINFEIIRGNKVVQSGYGVMYSAYTHDLDRKSLESRRSLKESVKLSRLLIQSVYQPTRINEGLPPLPNQYPVFVFPQDPKAMGKPSSTNVYMEDLGFQVHMQEDLEGAPLRLFVHQQDQTSLTDAELMAATLSIGQVNLEVIYPHLYHAGIGKSGATIKGNTVQPEFIARSSLEPFNRNNFTNLVKERQMATIENWLAEMDIESQVNSSSLLVSKA